MIIHHGCKHCGGSLYDEEDRERPALRDMVCFQCGRRTGYEVAVPHIPIAPEGPRPQVVFAEARAGSIAHLHLVQHASRAEVEKQLGVSPRTIDRAIRRASGKYG